MTEQILECAIDDLRARGSFWTAQEISQQPAVWLEALKGIEKQRHSIERWLVPLLGDARLRIVMSGAGTSSFVGETLSPWLSEQLRRRVDSLSTTDIVGDPGKCFAEDLPTLMISFARSGDSPESVASVKLADQMLTHCYHLILTCNPDGYLAKSGQGDAKTLCLLMPERSNDRGFAMTSSFTSMLVACAAIFVPVNNQVALAAAAAEQLIEGQAKQVKALADRKRGRLVVLGAGCLYGIAHEVTLKVLELSAGHIAPIFDTPLGFRHGPKSILNDDTFVVHLQSQNPYTAQYEHDLLSELHRDFPRERILELSPKALQIDGGGEQLDEFWVALPYLVYCQMFAFFSALAFNITADNPCPTGEVNRVVKGVTIYDYSADIDPESTEKVASI